MFYSLIWLYIKLFQQFIFHRFGYDIHKLYKTNTLRVCITLYTMCLYFFRIFVLTAFVSLHSKGTICMNDYFRTDAGSYAKWGETSQHLQSMPLIRKYYWKQCSPKWLIFHFKSVVKSANFKDCGMYLDKICVLLKFTE